MDTVFFPSYSSCGCLKASSHQGAIDVYVSQLGEVALTTEEGEPAGVSQLDCSVRLVNIWNVREWWNIWEAGGQIFYSDFRKFSSSRS